MSWGHVAIPIDVFGGRLTASSTTGAAAGEDEATVGSSNVYLVPFRGQRYVSLYYAGAWQLFALDPSSPPTLSLGSTSGSTLYDVFAYWDGSAVALEQSTAWTNSGAGSSARAVALAEQNGVYVKSGDSTRRYVGTVRTLAGGGQTTFTSNLKLVWSMYNRRPTRLIIGSSSAATHTYSGSARRWNNAAVGTYGAAVVVGLQALLDVGAHAMLASDSTSNSATATIYVDGVATNQALGVRNPNLVTCGTGVRPEAVEAGYHEVEMYEETAGGATGTFREFYGGALYFG